MKLSRYRRLAVVIAITGFSLTAQAGKITSIPSASGAQGFGGWNLNNVEIVINGTDFIFTKASFNENNGAYTFSPDSDGTYLGKVDDGVATIMGYVLAKDWPVGEPSGIKVINDDLAVKAPKPTNCIMATSYLADHFLDSADPQQVTCSSPFQTHKRYKLAMLPTTCDSNCSEGVDLVFNVEAEEGARDYQVFQKINNWTDGRLQGFTIQLGFGVGPSFQTVAEAAGIDFTDLHISVPSDIWSDDQLANFSAGLFGPLDTHTGSIGFFDPVTGAGFYIDEYVTGEQPLTDTLTATRTLGSDYNEVPTGASIEHQFGPWLPNTMLPYGVFFDDDGNPETDAELLAWYGYNPALSGFGWMGGSQDSDGAFSAIPAAEIDSMGQNLSYTMGEIDDLVNVGLNYVVSIGDVNNFPEIAANTFTIRITPTPDTSNAPAPGYVGKEPSPLLLFTSSDAMVLLEPKNEFAVGSLLTARVGDADLNIDPNIAEEVNVSITVSSNAFLSRKVTLKETGTNRGVFVASLPDEYSNVPIGTIITMTYVDANTGSEVNVSKSSTTTAIAALLPSPVQPDTPKTDFSIPENPQSGISNF